LLGRCGQILLGSGDTSHRQHDYGGATQRPEKHRFLQVHNENAKTLSNRRIFAMSEAGTFSDLSGQIDDARSRGVERTSRA
jgi:hypothetical protein